MKHGIRTFTNKGILKELSKDNKKIFLESLCEIKIEEEVKKLKAEGKDIDKLSCDNFRKKYGHWRLKDIKKLIELEEK
ncbi:hypothetical protein Q5M87_07005 [Brachyspira innocens]|uniref:Uncharacterized protein n=1 Tax=Brachyspira innocens TaxID=13264 RepID=A0ABT8YXH5_9SPIR|nr:hypothetical protein [Brachyspira innocens]MDO6993758.1 hypothetical protein [Brachyspira innocens]MDO7020588.1 hypothetical protein [Brachyspira innocens]